MKRMLISLLAAAIAISFTVSLAFAGSTSAGGNGKVTICHYPPGNPDNPQTITVSSKAVPAHLAHGDLVGECPSGCLIDPLLCEDGNLCTEDICLDDGQCDHQPVNCDDGDLCTTDSCDPASGCVHTPVTCYDGDSCTTDTCDPATGCVFGSVSCDDGNQCTDDSCDPATGCMNTNNTASCDDGNICTDLDTCQDGACVGQAIEGCS